MSELRDIAEALRSFGNRLTSVEDCLVILVRDSQQQSEWRHDQKGRAMSEDLLQEEREKALKQVQITCGSISHRLAEVVERLDNQAATRLSDVKELRLRVRALEHPDEVTKA